MKRVITIDGGVATGTSSLAKDLALALEIPRIDSGSMYRAITYLVIKEGIDPADASACAELAQNTKLTMPQGEVIAVNGETVEEWISGQRVDHLRSPEIDSLVPTIADHRAVREAINEQQRRFAGQSDVVADGRDTGTVVFPQATLKLFLTCSDEEAARRRTEQYGHPISVTEIRQRNEADQNHAFGALVKALDAVEIDTTYIPVGTIVELVMDLLDQPAAERPKLITRRSQDSEIQFD